MQPKKETLDLGVKAVMLPLAAACATVLVAWLFRHPEGGVFVRIEQIAAWLNGGQKPEVVTWPAWGYAWIIALIPSFKIVILLQAGIGILALTSLALRFWMIMPRQRTILTATILLAVPWHDLQVTLYPSAFAGSLTLLALLSLDQALINYSMRRALLAGSLIGMAQAFRSEFVLLPIFIGIGIVLGRRSCLVKIPSFRPVCVFVITALAFQLPWAVFYYIQTGGVSVTESNFGHVLYVSLGSHPKNPWGIKGDDRSADEAVRNQGYAFSSLSEEGNKVLMRLVIQNVTRNPYGAIQRTIRQAKNTLVAPFSWGEPRLDEKGALELDVLREELKFRLGVGVNVREREDYRRRGLYPHAIRNMAAVFALLYQCGAVGFGSLVLLLGMMGMMLMVVRKHTSPPPPLLYLLGLAALYKVLQDVLVCYQVNYLNNVYPMFLPFVSISLASIVNRFRVRPFGDCRAPRQVKRAGRTQGSN